MWVFGEKMCPWKVAAAVALFAVLLVGLCWLSIADGRAVQRRADEAGYRAGQLGQPPDACPYSPGWGGRPVERQCWLTGWQRGDAERRTRSLK